MEFVPKRITLIPSLLLSFDLVTIAHVSSGIYPRRPNRVCDRRLANRMLSTSSSNPPSISLKGVEEARRKGFSIEKESVAMIREYTPAHHSFDSGVIAGAVDNDHESPCEAAAHEMEEEAHLIGGKWIPLLNSPTGTDKYSETRLYSYLVIDPVEALNPRARDAAEVDIEIEKGISLQEVRRRIRNSELNVISAYAAMLAIDSLQSLGYVK